MRKTKKEKLLEKINEMQNDACYERDLILPDDSGNDYDSLDEDEKSSVSYHDGVIMACLSIRDMIKKTIK